MDINLPCVFGLNEMQRLHGIAYTSAIQTGAKGVELDELTAEIFASLAMQANRAEVIRNAKPALRLVGGDATS